MRSNNNRVRHFFINCAPVNHLCTITTASHLYKVYALAESLNRSEAYILHVLVTDSNQSLTFPNCKFYQLSDIKRNESADTILSKYQSAPDKLRWSLKPVFMKQLLGEQGTDKIIYLDNDLYFYEDYSFLFGLLDTHSILLTPHYYKYNPKKEQNWFEANFRVGLYNAGFVGASRAGIETLQWWADSCAYRCEKNAFRGLFDDQKYLDLVPVIDKNAHIVRHKGCNVAGWNIELCPRTKAGEKVLIDGEYPIVFIHFNNTTIREIVKGGDAILEPYYAEYVGVLKKHKPGFNADTLLVEVPFIDKLKLSIWKIATDSGI